MSSNVQIPTLFVPNATPIAIKRDGGTVVYEPVRACKTQGEVVQMLKAGSIGSTATWSAVCSIAFLPEVLSVLIPHAMGTDKRKAAAKVSGALRKCVEAAAGDNEYSRETVAQYCSTVAQQFAKGREQALVALYVGEGSETTIGGFVPRNALLAQDGDKTKEDAATCLKRLCKAYVSHDGSGIPTGTVSESEAGAIVKALAQALGRFKMSQLMDDAEADANKTDSNEEANTAAAERIKAVLTHGRAAAGAVKGDN